MFIREMRGKLPRIIGDISKFQKSELGEFIPNFPRKHVITSPNLIVPVLNQLSGTAK